MAKGHMPPSQEQISSSSILPVSIIIERQQLQHGRWSLPTWEAVGVVADKSAVAAETRKSLIHSDTKTEQYLWTGLAVELFKDAAESYWYNLVGKNPSLYVVCQEEEGTELVPFLVTADSAEANMHAEADDLVFAVPMPPEVCQWLERYVVENYIPQEKKKRKRTNWLEDSLFTQGPQGTKHGGS